MYKLSTNGLSIATLLVAIFALMDIDVSMETATEAVGGALAVAALVRLVFNQYIRADVKGFFFRR